MVTFWRPGAHCSRWTPRRALREFDSKICRFWRVHGDLAVCSVDGCERWAVARGWCRRHYARWKRTGQLEARPWERQGVCTVDGCERQAWSGGLCEMHRWRLREHGDPGGAAQLEGHRQKDLSLC